MSVDEVRNRRMRGFAAYGALEALPMPDRRRGAWRRDRLGQRDRRRLRFHRRDAGGDVRHARGAVGHGRRDAAAAARARQAAGQGPDVHRPQAHRRGGEGGRPGHAHRRARQARRGARRDRADHRQGVGGRAAPGQALHRSGHRARSARRARRSSCSRSRRTSRRTTGAPAWRLQEPTMSWTPRTLCEFVSERARTRGDAEALVTPTVRSTLPRSRPTRCAAPPRRCMRSASDAATSSAS